MARLKAYTNSDIKVLNVSDPVAILTPISTTAAPTVSGVSDDSSGKGSDSSSTVEWIIIAVVACVFILLLVAIAVQLSARSPNDASTNVDLFGTNNIEERTVWDDTESKGRRSQMSIGADTFSPVSDNDFDTVIGALQASTRQNNSPSHYYPTEEQTPFGWDAQAPASFWPVHYYPPADMIATHGAVMNGRGVANNAYVGSVQPSSLAWRASQRQIDAYRQSFEDELQGGPPF